MRMTFWDIFLGSLQDMCLELRDFLPKVKFWHICLTILLILLAGWRVSFLSVPYIVLDLTYGGPIHEGNKLLNKSDWNGALADYGEAIQKDKSNYLAYCRRGYAYNRLEKTSRSLDDFNEGIRLIADVKENWLRHGHRYIAYHRPIEHECYLNRGILHLGRGQYDQAKSDFDAAIRVKSSAEVHYLRAVVLNQLGDNENALHDANKAVQMDNNNPEYRKLQQGLLDL